MQHRCRCGVTLRDSDTVQWCYREDCRHTSQRYPSEQQVAQWKIDAETLNHPGWEPKK